MNLRSVFPPMPTPFKDGEVDPAAIQANVRRWIAAGLGGIVALGTNGEASLLDDEESDLVLETVRQEVPDGRTLFGIAGLKAALDLSGLEGGDPRPPLGPLPGDAIERIRILLNDTAD